MAGSFSRRKLAEYTTRQLQEGADPAALAQRVVAYLIDEKKTSQAELLIRDIETSLATSYGVVATRLTTAHPLDAQTRQSLAAFVREAESAQHVVITDEIIDESLLGGIIAETPNGVFDNSIRTALRQLRATTKD